MLQTEEHPVASTLGYPSRYTEIRQIDNLCSIITSSFVVLYAFGNLIKGKKVMWINLNNIDPSFPDK